MPTDRQQPLADFVNWVKANVTGDEKGEAQILLDRLFQALGHKVGWTLIPELSLDANGHSIRPDGTPNPSPTRKRGFGACIAEAPLNAQNASGAPDDDLEAEIEKQIKRACRPTSTIFEDTRPARLYEHCNPEKSASLCAGY